jgi:hypothetical protein
MLKQFDVDGDGQTDDWARGDADGYGGAFRGGPGGDQPFAAH